MHVDFALQDTAHGPFIRERQLMHLRKVISLVSLLVVLLTVQLRSDQLPSDNPLETTVSQLVRNPDKYLNKLVRVQAWAIFGWESGSEFLSDANPTVTPPSPRAWLWLGSRGPIQKLIGDRTKVHGWFTGYLRRKPQTANALFDTTFLRFETIDVQPTEPQPQSLADAIGGNKLEDVRKLIRSGMNLNAWDEYGTLPVFHAIDTGDMTILNELLAAGADPKLQRTGGETTLLSAAFHCRTAVAQKLLASGVPVDLASWNGETPLMMASGNCKDGVLVKVLLDAGADPNARAMRGFTALMAATSNPAATELLLKAGADPTAKNDSGKTAMDQSCDRGRQDFYDVCQLLKRALAKQEPK